MPFFLPVAAEALESKMAPQCRDHLFFFFFSPPQLARSFVFLFVRSNECWINRLVEKRKKKIVWENGGLFQYWLTSSYIHTRFKKKVLCWCVGSTVVYLGTSFFFGNSSTPPCQLASRMIIIHCICTYTYCVCVCVRNVCLIIWTRQSGLAHEIMGQHNTKLAFLFDMRNLQFLNKEIMFI